MALRAETVAPVTRTLFTCQHPHAKRRRYYADDYWCEVCRSCLAVRANTEGYWPPSRRVQWADGRMTDEAGLVVSPDWRKLLRSQ